MKVLFDHTPNDVLFHLMVTMDEEVPHARDLSPRGLRMLLPEFKSEHIGGFSDNHNVVNHCMITHTVGHESVHVIITYVLENIVDGFQHVGQPFGVFTRFYHKSEFCRGLRFLWQKATALRP